MRRAAVARPMAVALMLAWTATVACAADRPFAHTNAAVYEDDDEDTFGVESWTVLARRDAALHLQLEYSVDPSNSVQVELAARRDRRGEVSRSERGVEVEARHLFTDVARDDVGLGVVAGVEVERETGGDAQGGWHRGAAWLRGAASVAPGTGRLLHANLGVERAPGNRARWGASAAVVQAVTRRTEVFGEIGATSGAERVLHGGVRHWLRRERLALDVTLGRRVTRDDGRKLDTFATVGVAVFDLGI
jgi:hypothetical protein